MPTDFHFLRPEWFIALIPLMLLVWWWQRRRGQGGSWERVVDEQLRPFVLTGQAGRGGRSGLLWLPLALLLAVTALAGPVWQKLEQPLYRSQSALVVLLDLSRSMSAGDLAPNRLQRAKLKLRDILQRRNEGETALIAYAANPYVVAPLTSDTHTIAAQLPSLEPGLMPAQGSHPERAIAKGAELLRQAGAGRGELLLITDGIDGSDSAALDEAVQNLRQAGHRLSILAVATAEGAPIPSDSGGFVSDSDGDIVVPKLDRGALSRVASEGAGRLQVITTGDSDIEALLGGGPTLMDKKEKEQRKGDLWQEEGPWLLLPLLALAAFAFRRGLLSLVLLVALLPQQPSTAYADSFWVRPDQQGEQALQAGDPERAAQLFEDPQWRASALYRAGDYEEAAKVWGGLESAEADYNRGNALARAGRYPEALAAYESALEKAPGMSDAQHNKGLVEELLKKQSQNGEGEQDSSQQQGSEQGEGGEEQRGQDGSGEQQQSGQQGDSSGQQGQQQDGDPTASESQQGQQQSQGQSSGEEGAEQGERQSAAEPSKEEGDDGQQPEAAMAEQNGEESAEEGEPRALSGDDLSASERETQQATEQWLRRIPDDPGGLWRRKFRYQYQQQQQQRQEQEEQSW